MIGRLTQYSDGSPATQGDRRFDNGLRVALIIVWLLVLIGVGVLIGGAL